MSTKRGITISNGTLYMVVGVVIVIAFLLMGGWPWIQGMIRGRGSMGMSHWNWAQILISLGIGFILGLLITRRSR